MANNLRGVTTVWNNATTGANGTSSTAYVAQATAVAALITVNGATNITFQTGEPGGGIAGINADTTNMTYFDLQKKDGSGVLQLTLAGAGNFAIDLSPFAPAYIRLKSSSSVTATAEIVTNG